MSKKKIILFICIPVLIALLGVVIFLLVNNEDKPDDGETDDIVVEDPFLETDFISNGTTEYVIVIPEGNNSKYINMAANEIVDLVYQASGVELQIITDAEIEEVTEDSKYLSIGKTKVFKASEITATFEELGADGVRLYTFGNSIVMVGGGDRGSMYAAYEFLERQFHFQCYAADEYYIDTNVTNLKLKDFDVKEIPVFERRSVGLFCYSTDEVFRNRMRQELFNEGWIFWSHSHFKIMPKEIYLEAHEDWYSPDQTQLCLTNEAMTAEFTKNIIQYVMDNPDATHISLGQEDNPTWCTCINCTDSVSKYKESGTLIRFTNKVAAGVKEYIDQNEPGREFYISTFAYQKSQEAPIDANGNALDPSVYPAENVRMMIAPIYACNCHNYSEECNSDINNLFKNWNVVAKDKIFAWIYNKVFASYFTPFNNYSTLVQNYNILDSMGVQFVYHQGNKETEAGGMQELKAYVEARLMWDNSLNPEDLVKEFCEHYYKDAAEAYYEYYKLIRYSYAIWELNGLHCYNNSSASFEVLQAKYWTRDLVDQLNNQFTKMLESIEKYKETDPDLYEKLNLRIQKEYQTVRFFYLNYHFDSLTYEEAEVLIDDFEYYCNKHGISVWRENVFSNVEYTITGFVTALKGKLNQK